MVGAIVGAAASVAGGIANAIMGSRLRKKAEAARNKYLAAKKAENEAWYNRRYNESALDRADTQAAFTRMNEVIRQRNNAAAGTQAVMGGTEESVAATKQANANAIAQTTSNVVASADARKDAIEQQYIARKDAIDKEKMEGDVKDMESRSANVATAVNGALNAASNVANSLDTTSVKDAAENTSGTETDEGKDNNGNKISA